MKKRVGKSTNMYVMFGLLAVLFISLGYLSMQAKEGLENKEDKEEEEKEKKKTGNDSDLGKIVSALAAPKDGFRNRYRGREGFEPACPEGKTRKIPGGPCA